MTTEYNLAHDLEGLTTDKLKKLLHVAEDRKREIYQELEDVVDRIHLINTTIINKRKDNGRV